MSTANHQDSERVTELVQDYAALLDAGAAEEWLALFLPDAAYRVILRANHERREPFYLINEDRERLAQRLEAYRGEPLPATLHMVSNLRVRLDSGADAEATAATLVLRDGRPSFAGRYVIRAAKTEGRWRIRECLVILEGQLATEMIPTPI